MKQVRCVRSDNAIITTGTRYSNVWHTLGFGSTEANEQTLWAGTGTLSNLLITLDVAPGAAASGKGYTFTIRKNGVDTGLTVTIMETATTARDIVNTVSVAPDDLITISSLAINTPTSPGTRGVTMSLEYTSTAAGESVYGMSSTNLSASATVWRGPFGGWTPWNTTSGAVAQNVVAAAGVIDALRVKLTGSPGAGKNYTFNFYKNGVKQDGTGGTANTTVTIADADTTGIATFSLVVTGGDVVYIECVPSGTPTLRAAATGIKFTATTDGQSQMCGWHTASMNPTNPCFTYPETYGGAGNWSTTEAGQDARGSVTGFTLSGMQVVLTGSPGAGNNYVLDMRRNAASPGGTPTVTIADAATTGSDPSGSIAIADGDTWTIRSVPTSSPTARAATWGLIQVVDGGTTPGNLPNFIHHYKQQGIM